MYFRFSFFFALYTSEGRGANVFMYFRFKIFILFLHLIKFQHGQQIFGSCFGIFWKQWFQKDKYLRSRLSSFLHNVIWSTTSTAWNQAMVCKRQMLQYKHRKKAAGMYFPWSLMMWWPHPPPHWQWPSSPLSRVPASISGSGNQRTSARCRLRLRAQNVARPDFRMWPIRGQYGAWPANQRQLSSERNYSDSWATCSICSKYNVKFK